MTADRPVPGTGRARGVAGRFAAPTPAVRLASLRILVGTYGVVWSVVRLPAHLAHADQVAGRWQPVGVLAPFADPLPDVVVIALAVGTPLVGLPYVAGRRFRSSGPAFAAALLGLTTLDSSWGQVFHTENLMVLHVAVVGLAPAAADALVLDPPRRGGRRSGTRPPDRARRRARDPARDAGRATAVHGRYGWPLRLAALVVVVAYLVAGLAKLRLGGLDWAGGDVLRHLVAHDNLRKAVLGDVHSPVGTHLVRHAWLFPPLAVASLAVELGAGVALLGGRWRTAWVAAAWTFHVGVLALMAILFPYQLSGVAFAPLFRVERLVVPVVRRLGARDLPATPPAAGAWEPPPTDSFRAR